MKKFLKSFAVPMLVLSLVIGCSNSGTGGTTTTPTTTGSATTASDEKTNEKKIPITIAMQYWSGPKWAEDHPTIQYLNEKFNVDLKLQLINGSEYEEKLKVMAASGSLPDFYNVYPATYVAWQSEGAFVDLTERLPKYSNLSEAFPFDNKSVSILNPEGKIYGLPEISWTVRDTVQIRKDWLDNLGIEIPSEEQFTVDKFYEIAKAFATQDPDQNGVNGDTIGFTGGYAEDNISLRNAFGISNGWTEKDGQLVPHQTQVEEYKAFLSFMKKAYEEGVLDQDFALRKSNDIRSLRDGNKLGLFTYHNNYVVDIEQVVKKTFPETNPEIVVMAPPIGPTGQRGNSSAAIGTIKRVINAKADEEKIDRILQILDWWTTEEGTTIMKNGIEGVHYTKNSEGKYEITDRWEPEIPRYMNSNLFKRPGTDFNLYLWTDDAEYKRHEEYTALAEKYPWSNAAIGLDFYSETYINKGATIDEKFKEEVYKIILGRSPIEYIEQASADWLKNGGEQIIKEINEAAKN